MSDILESIKEIRYNLLKDKGFSDSIISRVDLSRANVSVPDSWVELINNLDEELSELYPDYKINQIKEKFGKMRFYCSGVGEQGYAVIDAYEKSSDSWRRE